MKIYYQLQNGQWAEFDQYLNSPVSKAAIYFLVGCGVLVAASIISMIAKWV
jgi:hypothetical protein